ncbi:hypothetical protein [Bdellovibrio svalbardensis]|uniref:HNH endonuclease n=1 Tax=Bdellovibrio svalbardensis TaxID=2972972 RepID=A0ABT6DN36_9BACT|nr:hypothetical protein [Bdellovibrio svalbardensis]MDG0816543.1 hypothetical protein [Bdellovibrio svalbardensis]
MKQLIALVLITLVSLSSHAGGNFPQGPDATLTPGALCDRPSSHRYPEGINYCERNVDSSTKKDIFVQYDQIGYRTRSMNRMDFKIDHYIPLCMGGANAEENLWPQHKSIYAITDPLEPLLCNKMAEGKLLQKDAIRLIKQGKAHLDQIPAIMQQVEAL